MSKSFLAVVVSGLDEVAGDQGRAKALRQALLHRLETGEWGTLEREWSKVAKRERVKGSVFDVLDRDLASKARSLTQAIFAMTRLGMPEKTARKKYGALSSDVEAVRALALSAGRELGSYAAGVDPTKVEWAAEVLHNQLDIQVIVTPAALQDLLFCAAEGYRVPKVAKKKRQGRPPLQFTEVYGLCFGTVGATAKDAGWKGQTVFYTVERCVPQLRAQMRSASVNWNEESTRVQIDVARRLSPQWRVLGDFHSHPYSNIKKLRDARGWEFSNGDEETNERFLKDLMDMGEKPVLGLVMAVARKGKAKPLADPHRFGKNTMQFTLGGYDYVLAAWVNPVDHKYGPAGMLQCVRLAE